MGNLKQPCAECKAKDALIEDLKDTRQIFAKKLIDASIELQGPLEHKIGAEIRFVKQWTKILDEYKQRLKDLEQRHSGLKDIAEEMYFNSFPSIPSYIVGKGIQKYCNWLVEKPDA